MPFSKKGISSISDNSQSKYVDIGNVRMQWGTSGAGYTNPEINFPVPFKNTSYSFTSTINGTGYLYGTMNGDKYVNKIIIAKKVLQCGRHWWG